MRLLVGTGRATRGLRACKAAVPARLCKVADEQGEQVARERRLGLEVEGLVADLQLEKLVVVHVKVHLIQGSAVVVVGKVWPAVTKR